MAKWIFEPGHSAAEFAVRHMMVSQMRGMFKNVHGSIDFDPDKPADSTAAVEAETYAMMLAGLGLVGFMGAARRRSLKTAA